MSSLPKPAAPATPLLSQFFAALAEKRARRAWGLAKDLFKAMPDAQLPKEELRAAFGLRLQSLLDEGVAREAVLMYDQVVANRPWLANPLPLALRMTLGREGAKIVPDPASAVAESAGDDTELQRCLQQEVVDLRAIAEGPVLPANSPWRAEAQLLLAAWNTLESGARLPALQAIGRRSPLLAWRLFLQALDAFYHHEDEQLAANVERLPSDSPLRPVALYLREVAQSAKVPEGDWQTELATKMGAGQSLHARLVVVDRVFSSGQKKNGDRTAQRNLPRAGEERPANCGA